jgi:hypothetical protein
MRFSQLAAVAFVLASTSLAAPLKRSFLGDVKSAASEVGSLINSNATASGIAGAVVQSVENPQLTAGGCPHSIAADIRCLRDVTARLTVVKGISDTQSSLSQIATSASGTGNSGVSNLVATGQTGLSTAHDAIDRIGEALVSGTKPSVDE